MCRIAEEGERRHQRLRRRRWLPEYSRSTLPFPLSVDWSMPSALPRTLTTTAKSCASLSLSLSRLSSLVSRLLLAGFSFLRFHYSSAASASEEHLEPTNTRDQHRQPFLQERKRQEVLLLDNEISFNEAIIEEREHGIREIEEQIGQANEIFKDLAVLVHEQGVVIGSIV
ncbi:hypothetical protein CerSpe_222960 [Prunus speciosa]